jgi:hypothetical protein
MFSVAGQAVGHGALPCSRGERPMTAAPDLDNLALACGHHHDQIHHRGGEIWIGGDRKPWLRPPSWIDPERPAVRNTSWDTQQAIRDCRRT